MFKYNNFFNCRREFKNIVLREVFVWKLKRLTGGWRILQMNFRRTGFEVHMKRFGEIQNELQNFV